MTTPVTLRLQGHLTAETCIATCPPGTPTMGKNPPAPLPKMTIGGVLKPYFPGSGLRGTLRRRAVDLVRSVLTEDGQPPFNLKDHYYLVLGGVKGDEKEDKADIVGADARRRANPILGLFGAGDPWQQGRLYVSHAVPSDDVSIQALRGARVDDFARSGDKLQILSEEEQQKWLHMAKITNARSKKAAEVDSIEADLANKKKDLSDAKKKELTKRMEALEAEIKEMSASSGFSNAINRPLDGYEVIPQGAVMSQSLTLSFGNMMEVGLLIGALKFWALDPWIGAHKSHGCGVVSGHWGVSIRRGYEPEYRPFGSVTMTAFEGIEASEELMAAERDFMDTLEKERDKFDFRYPVRAA